MKKRSMVILAAGVLSLVALGSPNHADADSRNRQKKLDKTAHHEVTNATAELQRDRADLRNLYQSGASQAEIDSKRAEIRDDLSQISQDRGQVGNYSQHRGDGDDDDRYVNRSRRSQSSNGWWNWSRNQSNHRDRWARDYRHD
jgi:hypothetical protein